MIDTNASHNVMVRRRRACRKCGYRFSTVEIMAEEYDALNSRVDLADAKRALHALNEVRQVLNKVYGG